MTANLPAKKDAPKPPAVVSAERALALRGAKNYGLVAAGATVAAVALVWNWGALAVFAFILAAMTGVQALRLLIASTPDASSSSSPQSSDALKSKINKLRFIENVGRHGENAGDQYDRVKVRLKTVRALLDEKFQPDELAYGRFKGAIERTSQAINDNLESVAGLLTNASQIEVGNEARNADAERLKIREDQLAKAQEILGFNERAITEIDRLSATLGEIQTKRQSTSPEISEALKDLEELVDLAKKLSL